MAAGLILRILLLSLFSKLFPIDNNKDALSEAQYITEEDVKFILTKYGYANDTTILENYAVNYASDKMIGFMAEYLKLQITVTANDQRKMLNFFVKAISKTNAAKAECAKSVGANEKEISFYDVIKRNLEVQGMKAWSPSFVTCLQDSVVFEDLTALQYVMRNRLEKFDKHHTLQALEALARFHASTIIFEERKTKEYHRTYTVNEVYNETLGRGGYVATGPWFSQCRTAALGTVKAFSKYRLSVDYMNIIENRWDAVFNSALALTDASSEHRNVICHRDLWNNNILFHYKKLEDGSAVPDDCVYVDFVAARYAPPAGDVMQLLHCNLSPSFRKDNLNSFLKYYYIQLRDILEANNIDILDFMSKDQFFASAKEQNLWGLVSCACLMQTFALDDETTINTFKDSAQFNEYMMKDRLSYIKVMLRNDEEYRKKNVDLLEEFIDHYLLN